MSRYRYLIERDTSPLYGAGFALTTITPGDDSGVGHFVPTVENAKAEAASDPNLDGAEVRWKDPPQAWQPDAVAVSQWLDDGVEDSRDS